MPRPRRAVFVALAAILSFGGCAASPGSTGTPAAIASPGASPVRSPDPDPSPSATPVATVDPLDTTAWVPFTSERYGFSLRHPADWSVEPADHDWSPTELAELDLTGHELFGGQGTQGQVGVSAWAVAPGPDVRLETMDELLAWVEDYCRQGGSTPCDGIADRAVPLCRAGAAACGTAVLVPFADDTQAFIPAYADGGMLIVSVWRPEVHRTLIPYGGARKLLEAYLSTLSGAGPDDAAVVPAPAG